MARPQASGTAGRGLWRDGAVLAADVSTWRCQSAGAAAKGVPAPPLEGGRSRIRV